MEGFKLRPIIRQNTALSRRSGLGPIPEVHTPAFLFQLMADPFDHALGKALFLLGVQVGLDLFGIEDRDAIRALSLDEAPRGNLWGNLSGIAPKLGRATANVPSGNRDHRRHLQWSPTAPLSHWDSQAAWALS